MKLAAKNIHCRVNGMARIKDPQTSKAILQALRQRQPGKDPASLATTAKYPRMKAVLGEVVSRYSTDTRLPSVRDIAASLDTSIVTAQRALTELVNEGRLYSRQRSGFFVAPAAPSGSASAATSAVPANGALGGQFLARFHFGTDSAAPYQQAFWRRLASDFLAGHPTTEPLLVFAADSPAFSASLDLFERSAWSRQWIMDTTPLLDLTHFAGEDLAPLSRDGRSVPLYHRTYFLFHNRTFLRRHGIALPAYRDFAGQSAYLRSVAGRTSALGLDPRPWSIQEPVTLLGREIERFFSLVRAPGTDAATLARFVKSATALIAFCQQCQRGVNGGSTSWVDARASFIRGELPFFLGYSVDAWEFSSREPAFDLAVWPTLCADDALFLSPTVGVINQRSGHPAESLRFLSYIRSRPVQEEFARTGNFGGNIDEGILPPTAANDAWLGSLLPRSYPFALTAPDAFYLAINILNSELWRALLNLASVEKAITQALHLGRSYLKMRKANGKGRTGDDIRNQ
ncbi:MAG: GntR family transcriptional regulator [Opitutaceae bacterium]|nr:GntR family transcriptional regulator [Opitutaceae bacterium]